MAERWQRGGRETCLFPLGQWAAPLYTLSCEQVPLPPAAPEGGEEEVEEEVAEEVEEEEESPRAARLSRGEPSANALDLLGWSSVALGEAHKPLPPAVRPKERGVSDGTERCE